MLCFLFAALVVVLDQFFKRWIEVMILGHGHEYIDVIPDVLRLVYLENTGAMAGILSDQRWLLAGIAFAAAIILVFILLRYTEGFWGTLGLAAVLGGTVGNLVDRVFRGYVVDMFRTMFMDFWIFNIADIFITLGFITFLIHFIVSSSKSEKSEGEALEAASVDQDDDYDGEYDLPDGLGIPDYESFAEPQAVAAEYAEPQAVAAEYAEPQAVAAEYTEPHAVAAEYAEPRAVAAEYAEPQPEAQPTLQPTSQHAPPELYTPHSHITPVEQATPAPEQLAAEQPETVSWQEYYEPAPQPAEEKTDTLSALDALESEIGAIGDYDVDEMLREYGFEED